VHTDCRFIYSQLPLSLIRLEELFQKQDRRVGKMRREDTEASCSLKAGEGDDTEEKQAQSSELEKPTSTEKAEASAQISTSRKRVRFHPSISQVVITLPTLREIDEDQKRALWWSLSDYQVFTDTARNISREVRRHPGLNSGLEEALRRALLASKNVDQVEDAMQQIPLDPVSIFLLSVLHRVDDK
jgi:hypothetical protein